MVRNFFIALAAVIAAPVATFAADLPSRKDAPPPPELVYDSRPIATWTGFYLGDQVGVNWTNDRINANAAIGGAPLYNTRLNRSGGLSLGSYAGYNYQIGNSFVIGLEADFNAKWADLRTTTFTTPAGGPFFPAASSLASEWINSEGSIRGRLGYTAGNFMLYGTGGWAIANVTRKYVRLTLPGGGDSFNDWKSGWTAGVGLEYMVANNWIVRAEYRYSQFDGITDLPGATVNFAGTRLRHRIDESELKIGLAYKFGSSSPVVAARY